jgi:hypothetical protein
MSGRLVTVATFENSTQAQVAKLALEAQGIRAILGDEMTVDLFWTLSNAISGVKVQVLEADADRAVQILERELGPDDDGEVDEEQLAAEAESAAREEEQAGAAEVGPASVRASAPEPPQPAGTAALPAEDAGPPPAERDWYARGLFFVAWFGLVLPPVAFIALYFFLNAAFGSGPISARGRFNLFVGGVVTSLGLCMSSIVCCGLGGAFR